jgi:hypothetical protein
MKPERGREAPYNCLVLTAEKFIREASMAMEDRYAGDCVTHACRVAELLFVEGRSPWIGRIRHELREERGLIHMPLIPRRYAGRIGSAWNTHYVACSGGEVFDPLVGTPMAIEDYPLAVFGLAITIETHLDVDATEAQLASGTIRRSFQPRSAAELV